jgi:hypothetical protein
MTVRFLLGLGLALSLGCDSAGKSSRHFEVTPLDALETKDDRRKKPVPYLGGPVLHLPRAHNLYWGAYWSGDEGQARITRLDGLTAALGGTPYIALTTQYTDKKGAPDVSGSLASGSAVVADSEPPGGLADDALQKFVEAQLPSVGFGAETVYFILTPPGVQLKSDMGTSCDDTCAYHSHFSSSGRDVKYAIVPSLDCWDVCGSGNLSVNGTVDDLLTLAYTHELAEAITDPDLNAWTKGDGEDEIGDRCDGGTQLDGTGGSWAVQDLWSNNGMLCANVYE